MGINHYIGHKMKILPYTLLPLVLAVSNSVFAEEKATLKSIEKIIVYGEKTERSLKDTTSSVALINAEELASGQFASYLDALSGIANVVFTDSLPVIRGVSGEGVAEGFSSFSSGAKPRVTVMNDGVAEPFTAVLSGDVGLWDIQQIEVLRGPQSSNSGRNSIGGIVYVKTNDPSMDEWEGAVKLGYANQDQFTDIAGMLSGPIIDNELALRVSLQRIGGESYLNYKTIEGFEYPFNPKEFDSTKANVKLQWQPASIAGLDMLLQYTNNKENGENHWGLAGPDLSKRVVISPFGTEISYAREKVAETKRWSLKTSYEVNENLSFELMIADVDYDYDFIQYPALALFHVNMAESNQTYDAKVSFIVNDSFQGYLGYFKSEREQKFLRDTFYDGYDESNSDALYGEFTFNISEQARIIAGGRIEEEEQYRFFDGFGIGGLTFVTDIDERIYLPKIAYLHDLNDDITLGASFRKGYNSGGGDFHWFSRTNYTFKPEYVDTYELSARQTLLNGQLNIAANLFYNDYDQYQYYGIGKTGDPEDFLIINIPNVISYGLETEVSYAISGDLTLSVSLGLLESNIEAADKNNSAMQDKELPMSADITASLGIDYWLTDNIQLTVHTQYVGEYYSELENTSVDIAGDYTETRISAAYIQENWRVDFYVHNVFDEDNLVRTNTDSRGYSYGDLTDPQTLGISASYHF